jgi:hypothetical protein
MESELLSLVMEHRRELHVDGHSAGGIDYDLSTQLLPIISKKPNIHVTQFCRTPNWYHPPVCVMSELPVSIIVLIDDRFELPSRLGRYGLSNTCRFSSAAIVSLHTSRFDWPLVIVSMANSSR